MSKSSSIIHDAYFSEAFSLSWKDVSAGPAKLKPLQCGSPQSELQSGV
jgi:hypothetical protein